MKIKKKKQPYDCHRIFLRGWWDHYLSETQRKSITEAVKIDENGRPIVLTNDQGQPLGTISDAISTLLYNIVYHFCWKLSRYL
jgi:hypothetical protein